VEKITPNVKAANVNEIWKSVRKKLWPISKNEPKFTDINTTQLQELYGLDKDNFVKFVAKKSNDNDLMEILIVQVEDGKQNAVQNGINKRISDLEKALENTKPEQYTLVKNSVMVNNNKYILFIIGNKSPEIKSIFNDMTIDNK
ncbi:MAG: DUF4358 domain-containing protein, partial [Clostridiales bacterium]|nr:DUF4358 domain-containing protein [Clostridiales bacterium]